MKRNNAKSVKSAEGGMDWNAKLPGEGWGAGRFATRRRRAAATRRRRAAQINAATTPSGPRWI